MGQNPSYAKKKLYGQTGDDDYLSSLGL
jgi:hypothetical protein